MAVDSTHLCIPAASKNKANKSREFHQAIGVGRNSIKLADKCWSTDRLTYLVENTLIESFDEAGGSDEKEAAPSFDRSDEDSKGEFFIIIEILWDEDVNSNENVGLILEKDLSLTVDDRVIALRHHASDNIIVNGCDSRWHDVLDMSNIVELLLLISESVG